MIYPFHKFRENPPITFESRPIRKRAKRHPQPPDIVITRAESSDLACPTSTLIPRCFTTPSNRPSAVRTKSSEDGGGAKSAPAFNYRARPGAVPSVRRRDYPSIAGARFFITRRTTADARAFRALETSSGDRSTTSSLTVRKNSIARKWTNDCHC